MGYLLSYHKAFKGRTILSDMKKFIVFFGIIALMLSMFLVQGVSYLEPFGEKPNCVNGNPIYDSHLDEWKCPVIEVESRIPVPQLDALIAVASVASNFNTNAVGEAVTITNGDSYKFEKTSTKYYLDEKNFQELYNKARKQEIMSEVDRINSRILNFCKVSNSSNNCSKENIYDIYEGGSISFFGPMPSSPCEGEA